MTSKRHLANAIRALSMDAVQKANSGHPGMPLGMADIAEVLWNDFLQHNPSNPHWVNRDRFILSNGHGCMLQYALLHLSGYDLSIEDIKQFRQLHSKTPGHPEYSITPGVETTTGPLGQGLANAVGMSLAEALLANEFNRDDFKIIDHFTYCFVGDGCLMEGISHEVSSLAGTLGLGKLIVFWDDNGISIDGEVQDWFSDDTPKRFEAYGWQVIKNVDGHDSEKIKAAILLARQNLNKPTLICCKTIIGFGAPHEGSAKCHGAPFSAAELLDTKRRLDFEFEPFLIPDEIYLAFDAKKKGSKLEENWSALFNRYAQKYPECANEMMRRLKGQLPADFNDKMSALIHKTQQEQEAMATRRASQKTLEMLVPLMPELLGGSADLSESNLTHTRFSYPIKPKNLQGNYLYYGVREFGMSAMMNGISLYQGFIPYGGTFLTFLDYARNAVRLAALMKIRVIFIYTHDSIGLGEDGPTHQPIEHLVMLRATPNMSLWRPCDATETMVAWQKALERVDGPTSIALTRQVISHQKRTEKELALIEKGGYILVDCRGKIDAILIATGSEVELAVKAESLLRDKGYQIRVVSMPSMDTFMQQPKDYIDSVLPKAIEARVAIEAGATLAWYQWVGLKGIVLGIDRFGESAPSRQVFEARALTETAIVSAVEKLLHLGDSE